MTEFISNIKLSDLEHLRSNPMIRFAEQTVAGKQVTIVTYIMLEDKIWREPGTIECRGIVFDEAGNCICRPFHKFFNLNENQWNMEDQFQWNNFQVMEKVDGSLISACLINGKIHFKSKASFYSEVAVLATQLANQNPSLIELCKYFLYRGYTPNFEFTHPDNRVVIGYPADLNFRLLAAREIYSGTYMDPVAVYQIADGWNIPTARIYQKNLQEIKEDLNTLAGFEGYVIQFNDGHMLKTKTKWYLAAHRVKTQLRWRDLALIIADEQVDDLKAWINSYPDLDVNMDNITLLEEKIYNQLSDIERVVAAAVQEDQGLSVKDFALKWKENDYFPLLIAQFKGLSFSLKEFWKKKYLQTYSLRSIENPKFGDGLEIDISSP